MQRSSENDLGCASQNLFLALTSSSSTNQIVIPLLKEVFQNVTSQRMAVDIESGVSSGIDAKILQSVLPLGHPMTKYRNKSIDPSVELVLQWDSIFTAVGLVGGVLDDDWFESYLGQCLEVLLQREAPRQVRNRSHKVQTAFYTHRKCSLYFIFSRLPTFCSVPTCQFFLDE